MLFACSVGLYAAGSELPEARQIDLMVLEEEPDGACRVRWHDPYLGRSREASYQCDAGRSDRLKAPRWDGSPYGWDTAYMLTEGPERGNLEELADDQDLKLSDAFLLAGTLLVAVGLVGGNLRAVPRVIGVQARLVRRATELSQAAARTAEDYARAVSAVREARGGDDPLRADRGLGSELVTALWVLREAGPGARETAALARKLTHRLDGLLEAAAPAAGLRTMLRAGPVARRDAAEAVAALRPLLAEADRGGLRERFAQTSVDLLRGQGDDEAALAGATDFARDPAAYRELLAELTRPPVLP
ncbi:hypothetical protein [Streptomyces flavalbus]|uniref:Bifunctional protein n=1 Tax=Streptomyces flavalbus TaxID=2665155 RepID=A0ABW2WCD9_9ACTN